MILRIVLSKPRVVTAALLVALIGLLSPVAAGTASAACGPATYTVQSGDTLYAIAGRCGISVQALMQANNLTSSLIYAGQQLDIPGPSPYGQGPAYAPPLYGYGSVPSTSYGATSGTSLYEIQPGDTLSAIARRFGTTVAALASLNHIFNPNLIFAETQLLIPGISPVPTTPYTTYIIQPGDTLTGIAVRFGTTVYALMIANNIPNPNLIFAGSRLIIPPGVPGAPYGTPYAAPTLTPTPTPGGATPTPSPTPTGITVYVSLSNLAYHPSSITIHVGTTVVWTNNESSPIQHTVTSGTPGAPTSMFDSGILNPGQSFQFTFNSPGTYPYYCRIHGAAMTGTVTVTP